jgi:hypothetical protein
MLAAAELPEGADLPRQLRRVHVAGCWIGPRLLTRLVADKFLERQLEELHIG